MRKILIIIGHYVPGFRDGGPVRSIVNLTDQLGEEYDFSVLTVDRDALDEKSYPQLEQAPRNPMDIPYLKQGKATVYYVPPGGITRDVVKKLADDKDVIYIPGFFNRYGIETIIAWRSMKNPPALVFAPMGIFTPGAFRIRYPKKKAYCLGMRLLGLTKGITWSVSNEEEAADTRRQMGRSAKCQIAQDLPRFFDSTCEELLEKKKSSPAGSLRIVALSRISEKKNFAFIPSILSKVSGKVTLDIYGYMEDEAYWNTCLEGLEKMPTNICWQYKGAVEPEQVIPVMSGYDVFLFPTTAENYGHVIIEALAAGTIPVISDRTPWTGDKLGEVGFVVPLGEGAGCEAAAAQFADAVSGLVDAGEEELARRAKACLQFALDNQQREVQQAKNQYRRIFDGNERRGN